MLLEVMELLTWAENIVDSFIGFFSQRISREYLSELSKLKVIKFSERHQKQRVTLIY